jgi:hypothetical protein
MGEVGCAAQVNVTSAACKGAMKNTLVQLFAVSLHLVRLRAENMKKLKAELSSTNSPRAS